MNTRHSLTLLGLALGILLALLIVPQTRWLVRLPFLLPSALPGRDTAQRQAVVQAHPQDFQIQLAGQPQNSSLTPLAYDRSLVPRFPDSASLRAKILRDATTREVRLHRDEDNLLEGKPATVFQPGPNDPVPAPAQLAAFDADAAAGERLNPDNAYFPLMRAVGLFASHRDSAGLAAVQRASTKHVWNEYVTDEVEGRWRINRDIYGGQEALSAAAASASVLFPEYAQLRAAARVVVYKAILDEQAGHPEAGLAKREALGRCGELMGVQSTAIIGNLVGVAINQISRSRPGGAPRATLDTHLPSSQRTQIYLDSYCAYVTKIGHPDAAVQARADYQTWQQIQRVTSKIEYNVLGNSMASLVHAGIALSLCVTLLPNILSVFVLGLIAARLSRLPRIQRRESLPAGAAIGFWIVALLGCLLTALFVYDPDGSFKAYAALFVLAPLLLVGILALAVPRLRRPISAGLIAVAITLAVAGLVGLAASWQAVVLGWIALCFAVPVLLMLIWSIVGLVKHVPFSVKAVENFRAVMPPLVCALMLAYGGLTLWTVQQEAQANYGLERSLHGEGQYLAQLTGQAWPRG